MTALLLKDWFVLKRAFWSAALIMLVWAIIPQSFLNSFAIIYGAMIPYTVMAYDRQSRWDSYTRMLPIRDRDVVLSRYVLGWLSVLAGAALVTLIQGAMSLFLNQTALPLFNIFVSLCVGCILLAFNLPMIFRFGTEKARWLSVVIIVSVCAAAGALGNLPYITGGQVLPGLQGWTDVTLTVIRLAGTAVLPLLTLAATAVSIPLSLRFYREGPR